MFYIIYHQGNTNQNTMSNHTPIGIAKIQNTDNIKCWQGCGATRILHSSLMGMQNNAVCFKDTWQFLIKHTLSKWSNSHAPWYLPKEVESCIHTKIWTWMFIAIMFIINKTLKQPKCPSVGEWINCGTSRQWNI